MDEDGNPLHGYQVFVDLGPSHATDIERTDEDGWAYFDHEDGEDTMNPVVYVNVGTLWHKRYDLLDGSPLDSGEETSFTIPKDELGD